MRVLLDTCVWGGALSELQASGHDALWTGDWDEDPGDEEILAFAHGEKRVLITLDKDFGEWAIVHGASHYGIVRLVPCPARKQGGACVKVLDRFETELLSGAVVTVEPGRVRVRPRE